MQNIETMENLHYELFVSFCNELADKLHTIVETKKFDEYNWASIVFMTDTFGGVYLNLHYDLNNGKVVVDYGCGTEIEVTHCNQLVEMVRERMDAMLEKRDLDYIGKMINNEY